MSWPSVDGEMSVLVPDPENEPGCAVGVVRDDEILYLQGYGYARLPGRGDPGEKWTVATMGAVGSVSKTFTAAAVMRMHDLGLIDVNDQVEDYLSTGNGPLGNTYIYDLLGHSSGVGGDTQDEAFGHDWEDGTSVTDCIENDPESASCLALFQELARPASAFPYYAPTEAVADLGMAGDLKAGVYSNVGYSVLGAIVDRIAQDSTSSDGYEAFVWDEIGSWAGNFLESGNMLSLALTHSWRDEDIPHRAVGYLGAGPAVQEAWNAVGSIEGWEGPSGGWAMTIGDLSRFMIALDNADFFDDADMRAIMQHEWTDLNGSGSSSGRAPRSPPTTGTAERSDPITRSGPGGRITPAPETTSEWPSSAIGAAPGSGP
jgi:CubicO group peptidase (beta-lactamase class C family)